MKRGGGEQEERGKGEGEIEEGEERKNEARDGVSSVGKRVKKLKKRGADETKLTLAGMVKAEMLITVHFLALEEGNPTKDKERNRQFKNTKREGKRDRERHSRSHVSS